MDSAASSKSAPKSAQKKLNPRQRRLLTIAATAVLVIVAGIAAYIYISGAPQRAEDQYQAAMKHMQPGQYQQAVAELTRSIQTHELARAYLERGVAHHFLGENDQATADLEKATGMDPSLARAYSVLGSIYREKGDTKRAVELYTKSIQISANVDALFERGQLYESLGQHQKAVDDFSLAIDAMRDAPYLYRARAMAKTALGDNEGAEADRNLARSIELPHH
jgi:tetratricopeptide (TPR) repeat protein